MKPKTDDKGVRRAVFSTTDVKLWHRMLDSLVEFQIIEREQPLGRNAEVIETALKAILAVRVPEAESLPDKEHDDD